MKTDCKILLYGTMIGILVHTAPVVRADDLYSCDGKWTNVPCAGSVEKKITNYVSQAVSSSSGDLKRTEMGESSSSSINGSGVALCRNLITARPVPEFQWNADTTMAMSGSRIKFWGTLKGNGPIDLIATFTSNCEPTRAHKHKKQIKLADKGESVPFDFSVNDSMINCEKGYNWTLVPQYAGDFKGYRNLQGCCSYHDGVGECKPNGDVVCDDGTTSPTCKCDCN